jgi:hypothetical protein
MRLRPKHSFESVVDELITGLENGTVTIPGSMEPSALANSISDEFTKYLNYTLDSYASKEEFTNELQSALKNATSRIWLCCADLSGIPANFALVKREHKWLDMRLIVPWDEVENNRSLITHTRIFDSYAFRNKCNAEERASLWLIIIDNVAYCRFANISKGRATFDHNVKLAKDWSSLVFRIEARHREVFEKCEYMFRNLWDDNTLTKPAVRGSLKE